MTESNTDAAVKGCGVLAVLALCGGIAIVNRCQGDDEPETAEQTETEAPPKPTGPPKTEDPFDCTVTTGDGDDGPIPLFVTEAALDAFAEADAKGDKHGKLAAARQAVPIEPGTPCRILDPGLMTSKIRIEGGPHDGKAGFVPREWAPTK